MPVTEDGTRLSIYEPYDYEIFCNVGTDLLIS